MEDIKREIIKLIRKMINAEHSIELNSKLKMIGVNSLIIIRILIELEKTFKIELEDEDLIFSKYVVVNDLVKVISKY